MIRRQLEADVDCDEIYGVDWSWRPRVLREKGQVAQIAPPSGIWLSEDCRLHHDAQGKIFAITRPKQALPHRAFRLEAFVFEGSFLELELVLPPHFLSSLRRFHILRFSGQFTSEYPMPVQLRFELNHGANTLRFEADLTKGPQELDLGLRGVNDQRLREVRLFLRFMGPETNAVTLNDFTLLRYPRADL